MMFLYCPLVLKSQTVLYVLLGLRGKQGRWTFCHVAMKQIKEMQCVGSSSLGTKFSALVS